VTGQRIFNFDA